MSSTPSEQEALAALKDSFAQGKPLVFDASQASNASVAYAVGRFLAAWKHSGSLGPDHAVLFRQIVV